MDAKTLNHSRSVIHPDIGGIAAAAACTAEGRAEYSLEGFAWPSSVLLPDAAGAIAAYADVWGVVESTRIVDCPLSFACVAECNGFRLGCRAGHTGAFCAVCAKGWALVGQQCAPCNASKAWYWVSTCAIVAFSIAFLVFQMLQRVRRVRPNSDQETSMRQMINFLQTVRPPFSSAGTAPSLFTLRSCHYLCCVALTGSDFKSVEAAAVRVPKLNVGNWGMY